MKTFCLAIFLLSCAILANAKDLRGGTSTTQARRHLDIAWVGGPDLARDRPVTVSSTDSAYPIIHGAPNMVDGNGGTRWASGRFAGDNQTIDLDLGDIFDIDRVRLGWQTAHAKSYQIWLSTDSQTWTTVYSTEDCTGGFEELTFDVTKAQFVHFELLTRATQWGFSLWDLEVYKAQDKKIPPVSEPTLGLPQPSTPDVARSSSVFASTTSTRGGTTRLAVGNIVDGNNETRWSSEYAERQWIGLDLGGAFAIDRIRLGWEEAYAKAYEIWVSVDAGAANWTNVYSTNSSMGGFEDLMFEPHDARYIHMNLLTRANAASGFSMRAFEVYQVKPPAERKPAPPAKCGSLASKNGRGGAASEAKACGSLPRAANDFGGRRKLKGSR